MLASGWVAGLNRQKTAHCSRNCTSCQRVATRAAFSRQAHAGGDTVLTVTSIPWPERSGLLARTCVSGARTFKLGRERDAPAGDTEYRPAAVRERCAGQQFGLHTDWVGLTRTTVLERKSTCRKVLGTRNGNANTTTSRKVFASMARTKIPPRRSRPGRSTRNALARARRRSRAVPRPRTSHRVAGAACDRIVGPVAARET